MDPNTKAPSRRLRPQPVPFTADDYKAREAADSPIAIALTEALEQDAQRDTA